MMTVSATEFQNNFGKYLQAVQMGGEIVILKNGVEVASELGDIKYDGFKELLKNSGVIKWEYIN